MVAVITGDIVNSRSEESTDWLPILKNVLNFYGTSPKQWEIFRGDSFQISVSPHQAFQACIHIKAAIKSQKNLDVRMAIGIGEETYNAGDITEANGSAYIRSGDCFDFLKKQNLAIRTSDSETDEILNLLFSLALLTMDAWSSTVARLIKIFLEHPDRNQKELSELVKKSQSSVSEGLKRGGYAEVMELNSFFKRQVAGL